MISNKENQQEYPCNYGAFRCQRQATFPEMCNNVLRHVVCRLLKARAHSFLFTSTIN